MKSLNWQLIISVATLIVTPLASALVVNFQLQKSHSFWMTQQRYIQAKEFAKRKFDLYEGMASALARLEGLALAQQVYLFSRNKCLYGMERCSDKGEADIYKSQHSRYVNLITVQYEKIEDQKAEITKMSFLWRLYFGERFEEQILALVSDIKHITTPVIDMDETVSLCDKQIQEGKTIKQSFDLLDPIFDKRWENKKMDRKIADLLVGGYKELENCLPFDDAQRD